jgi:pyruvate,water dikinase
MKNILWFKEIRKDDVNKVGGKGANLGEMYSLGIPVPNGFVVTVDAYFQFLKKNQLEKRIRNILSSTNIENSNELQSASKRIKKIIIDSPIPDNIAVDIMKSYLKLGSFWGLKQPFVAVRSSATAEDLPDASFAGQQETFLNVRGESNVVNKTRACWASLFTPRAIFYREKKGFDHFKAGVAVPIQKMVQSDVSGVMFTVNPVTNDKKTIVIEAVWGLGETIVQGQVTPDHYEIEKDQYMISKIEVEEQKTQLIRHKGKNVFQKVAKNKIAKAKLNPLQISELAKLGQKLHEHYFFPQDIEWSLEKNKFYIVQTRPITTLKSKGSSKSESSEGKNILLLGDSASPGIATGKVRIIRSAKEISKVKKGEILVTEMTTPDFVPAMRIVSGIITEKGGQTSHAAIVSRELAIPCVVGAKEVLKKLKTEQLISINGETGEIFEGKISAKTKPKKSKTRKIKTATKLYLNLAEPQLAKELSKKRVDGIGLLRAEFMIAGIGKHPQKIIQENKQDEFIDKLAKGIGEFCKNFSPRPVVYRATDFKTNEYKNLEGGEKYEKDEENPLIGFRGAMRYINTPDIFALEIEAIKRVRNKMGYKNLWLMIPFVRTPKELVEIKRILASLGLSRTPSFKLWMMVEVPTNVIRIKDFIEAGIDGVSIGSNDLTMLVLGLDRDNSQIAHDFDERDKAVLWSLRRVIKTCNKYEITSSICGQAPSNYPDLVENLVRWGVTSISVNPDAIDKTREIIAEAEEKVLEK